MRKTRIPLLCAVLIVTLLTLRFFTVSPSLQTPVAHAQDADQPQYPPQDPSDLLNGSADQVQNLENADQAQQPDAQATPTPALPVTPPQWVSYEASLPVPVPTAGGHYVMQLVNESNVPILGTANTANEDPNFLTYPQCTGNPVVV